MSANDCCGMLLSCCMCFSSSYERLIVLLDSVVQPQQRQLYDPVLHKPLFDDTSAADEVMAERDHEAALFDQRNNNVSAQPTSVPAMAVDAKSARTPAGPNIRDKAHILSDE
ncbi:hypothetical protein B0H11DRAFT_1901365 [Mycena galericulata]|nr:hypothetical protein B0H11DRAFT_1901365 [Mycena galericulata]